MSSQFSGERYRDLMREHGYLRDLAPGEKSEPQPCGCPAPARACAQAVTR